MRRFAREAYRRQCDTERHAPPAAAVASSLTKISELHDFHHAMPLFYEREPLRDEIADRPQPHVPLSPPGFVAFTLIFAGLKLPRTRTYIEPASACPATY